MKRLVSIVFVAHFLAATANLAVAQHARLEAGAIIGPKLEKLSNRQELFDSLVVIIRVRGWRCDSISAARTFFWGRGFDVKCNGYAYHYQIEDRGGRWVVTLK